MADIRLSAHNATTPAIRVRALNRTPVRPKRGYVLYWMIAARRARDNFALQRAVDWACELDRPLVVLEALRCGYRWASDRLHRFVIDGMVAQARHFAASRAGYYPYVERAAGAGRGLLAALAKDACVVVSDDFPGFFLPRMLARASEQISARLEVVDGNGLYPLADTERVFTTAASFRRHLHKQLAPHLGSWPAADPLERLPAGTATVPAAVSKRWPALEIAAGDPKDAVSSRDAAELALAELPIDHGVGEVATIGGAIAAERCLARFLDHGLPRYADDRNRPDDSVSSGLSPYLHFGHVSAHRVFERVMAREDWSPARIADKPTGSREGWWGASREAEAFIDELVTWRELGYNAAAKLEGYDEYESLPEWARTTLEDHLDDPRPHCYELPAFEAAETHDPVWNAAQTQLVREGRVHNYLRMLWGKKILEWSPTPRAALAVMIELNNKYALDGRDPNSYSGIFWCLGRYDRAWGPERPIFGKIRYMSSDSTRRKCKLRGYLRTYGPATSGDGAQ